MSKNPLKIEYQLTCSIFNQSLHQKMGKLFTIIKTFRVGSIYLWPIYQNGICIRVYVTKYCGKYVGVHNSIIMLYAEIENFLCFYICIHYESLYVHGGTYKSFFNVPPYSFGMHQYIKAHGHKILSYCSRSNYNNFYRQIFSTFFTDTGKNVSLFT